MWMHAEGMRPVILKEDVDRIPDLRVQHRAHYAEVVFFRLAFLNFLKSFVGIFPVAGLAVLGPDAVRPFLCMHLSVALEGLPRHMIDPLWRVVPFHFVGCDVVSTDFASLRF